MDCSRTTLTLISMGGSSARARPKREAPARARDSFMVIGEMSRDLQARLINLICRRSVREKVTIDDEDGVKENNERLTANLSQSR